MNKSIEKLNKRIAALEALRKLTVKTVQVTCKHEHLAECDYMPVGGYGTLPPMRVCLDCGMTEDGWGPGYVVLHGEAAGISRDDLYARRCGLAITDSHKGPLLRREVTVEDLISRGS